MADIKELLKQRSSIRGRLTKFNNYLEPLLSLNVKDINKQQVRELSLRLEKLNALFMSFDDIQTKIELDDDSDLQLEERESTETVFYGVISRAQELLDSLTRTAESKEEVFVPRRGLADCSNIKLPTIKLPPFDGSHSKWLEFRDTFQSLIHDNSTIDQVSKFHYLKSCLEGAASSVIKSINVSSENYAIAWQLLCERYDNKRLLINHHLKCLFSIEPLSKENEKCIRNLIDTMSRNLRSLKMLGEHTEHWDSLIIYMVSLKLDPWTARKWEEHRSEYRDSIISLEDFYSFLRSRADVLETLNVNKPDKIEKPVSTYNSYKTKSFVSASAPSVSFPCVVCKEDHRLYDCPRFKSMSLQERYAVISQCKLCSNCLRSGHQAFNCRIGGCRVCNGNTTQPHRYSPGPQYNHDKSGHTHASMVSLPTSLHTHETSLHLPASSVQVPASVYNTSCDHHQTSSEASLPHQTSFQGHASVSMSAVSSGQVLLSTALVRVTNNDKSYILRALLDSGSQSSFITSAAQQKIGCETSSSEIKCVSGINNASFQINKHCNLQLSSLCTPFSLTVKCFVVPIITDKLPNAKIEQHFEIPQDIILADPNFCNPAEIDLLLGADIFWDIIGSKKVKLGSSRPILRESHLGWLVAGPTGGSNSNVSDVLHCNFSKEIETQLAKFWELEELPAVKCVSTEDKICESVFTQTTFRDEDGRFCVEMPLREPVEALGESYHIAKTRLINNEKRFNKNLQLKQSYRDFINEYKDLGHLEEIQKPNFGCYLPHHAVLREQSETTKLRVVFDASAKTSSGKSLNEIQYTGPTVQDELFSILLRFRQHRYALSADVEKMYRQILINPRQRFLQLILWREEQTQPIKVYQLNTVTYGTASAPFLSTRCLLQLAHECPEPEIAQIIKHDFYMDDLLTGADTEEELRHICSKVTKNLNSACFPLRKYRTNAPSIFEGDPCFNIPKNFDVTAQSSVLGLKWQPLDDFLQFSVQEEDTQTVTKRTILSQSSKLFDPLGLLSACTIIPKLILQRLWSSKLDWDDEVPTELTQMWLNFINNLKYLKGLSIPRSVLINNINSIQLHSFSDASQNAYAACIYMRSTSSEGDILSRLLCAKTKVAPLKPTTIPRLELLGALLSVRLTVKVLSSLRCTVAKVVHWTDSKIVLGWLMSEPRNLKTFVSNRVGEILDTSPHGTWRHVPGPLNPADLGSRGIEPQRLRDLDTWWQGPTFLSSVESSWPPEDRSIVDLPEIKICMINNVVPSRPSVLNNSALSNNCLKLTDFDKFSKYGTLLRAFAYVLRFIHNTRNPNAKFTGALSVEELESSQSLLIKQAQQECFDKELNILNKQKNLPLTSNILSLSPFLDEAGCIRVGGRLQNSAEPYAKIHPLLLLSSHALTKLIFSHEHVKNLHVGAQELLSIIRQRFWPTKGRILARKTVNNCKTCRLMKAKTFCPMMGNLPAPRVTPNLPFHVTGTDFAGPFLITDRKGRGCKITKCYLCLFVCLSTKALHLEVASDLSTDVFILCLRRFIARRGKPLEIYCDNGTNFVGANNELSSFLKSNSNTNSMQTFAAGEGIKFVFSPAYTPHFGGLWEAGVKSAKFHLSRILGNTHLTFEELSTLFSQVEAILNSRPLTPLSSDPTDLNPLTPGHFLIGRALTSLPGPVLLGTKLNRLKRYQVIEQFRQQFWDRWSKEYLAELQQRSKWRVQQRGLQAGDLVVMKENHLPPLKWHMGRISQTHPGSDGVARVVDVATHKGTVRRAVSNLCPLLPDEPVLETQDVRGGGACLRPNRVGS